MQDLHPRFLSFGVARAISCESPRLQPPEQSLNEGLIVPGQCM